MAKVLVKNRAPAPVQITAEQIILEATDRAAKGLPEGPRQHVLDQEELDDFRQRKRKEFEDAVRRQRHHIGNWLKYAKWEESQMDLNRARSIYERALDVDYKYVGLWLKYAEMEQRHKAVNRARNVWDRAVSLLPRIDQFWYKYCFMEEMLGNVPAARAVFERWMKWEPDENGWLSYVKFEVRQNNLDTARKVYERFLQCHCRQSTFIKYAKWEERNHQIALARRVFERSLQELARDQQDEGLYIEFAQFEERCREFERARFLYKAGLELFTQDQAKLLYQAFISFEKKYGDRESIEEVIVSKRRAQYEAALAQNSSNYDAWFDFARLEESYGDVESVRAVYARAVANQPPVAEKRFWRRYVYLWINWAMFEELDASDILAARQVYTSALNTIPHKEFTFAKLWLLAAQFEVRQKNLSGARKLLGTAIGACPKERLFTGYIDLELQLGAVDRCRTLYQQYLKFMPLNCQAWIKYAGLEQLVGEDERARAIYELAIEQPALDKPETLWKAYIEFEIELQQHDRARDLYERLLERTKHVKVWLSYAQFEAGIEENDRARQVFSRAADHTKLANLVEERVMVLEAWRKFEVTLSDNDANIESVKAKQPRKLRKRRELFAQDGSSMGFEEYIDYVFPDDDQAPSRLKFLNAAAAFMAKKRQREEEAAAAAASTTASADGTQ